MSYFDTAPSRLGTASYKWDSQESDVLPMWVADMDFRTSPEIIEALEKRVAHGIFGYTRVPEVYYRACIDWFERRHGWRFERDWVIYTSGVVPAVSAIIKAMTAPGDKVVLQTPAYNCFYSSIRNNGCGTVPAPLVYGSDGSYNIDFEGLEALLERPDSKAFILCNPHNPTGRVWTAAELHRMATMCQRHGVFVIADEIHCELTYPGHDYTPFGSVCTPEMLANCTVCLSPSKAFNIAGLQIANIVAFDPEVRNRIDRAININEVCDVNPFGVAATIAAYNHSERWLDALRRYLWDNYCYVCEVLGREMPDFKITPLEGTYLVWINITATGLRSDEFCRILEEKHRIRLSPGTIYGPGGEDFVRLNIACPRSTLAEGLRRLTAAF